MSLLLRAIATACAVALAWNALALAAEAADQTAQRLTLERALAEALARSPELRARRAEVEQAEGRLLTARTYPHNPELTVEGARRTNGESATDSGVTLVQEIEIGGQRRRRTDQANSELEASRAQLLREERLLAARVRAAFVETLRIRELLEVEQANTELARSLGEVARKRFVSGAIAQMELNLAQVQVGRAERELRLAQGAYEVARTVLAEVIGSDPARPPEPDGNLDLPPPELLSLTELLTAAVEHREDLRSFRESTAAARARVELARREAIPNLALEAFHEREEGSDRISGGAIGIRIPLFDRNRGPIAEARAAQRQAEAQTEATELRVRQEVAASLARYHASRDAAANLERQVLGTLEENLRLLQRSFESGKTGWTEVLVFRREFVDVHREYIEALADARLAGIELDLAAGILPAVADKESQP